MERLDESKKPKQVAPVTAPSGPKVVIHRGKVFKETAAKHNAGTPGVQSALEDFIKTKMANPTERFGSKDTAMGDKYHFGKAVPGIKHAGLTNDVSVFYTVSGANPHHVHLHGVFSHDEAGIGQPANINKQKSTAKRMSNQEFID